MSPLSAKHDDVTVVVPQYLIDRALQLSDGEVLEILPYDEGLPTEQPLYYEEESRFLSFARMGLITAIVGSMIVFTGLQVADSHAPAVVSQASVATGIQSMSATELIQSIKKGNHTVYWLDAKPGDTYTNNSTAQGIDQVIYRPEGADVTNLNQFDVIVETYANYLLYDNRPHPLLGANERSTTLANGATVTYNVASADQAVVIFPNKPEVVVINYPAVQTVPTIINDASRLSPIN